MLRCFLHISCLFIIAINVRAQISNPDFEDWHWVTIAQPYLDPDGWTTNNTNQFGGVASTPVDRASDSTGYYAYISSSGWGVDASLPGFMYQRIPTKNLSRLNIIARCDSLWGTGKCVIRISGENNWDFLYTDSIGVQEEEFIKRSIDIPGEWNSLYDSITIKLEASGYVDMWDEMDDGYATFLMHRVTANQRLLTPGRTWIYAYNEYEYLPGPVIIDQSFETITIEEDTLINGLAYSRLVISESDPCGVFNTEEYLREEGSKIFRLSSNHMQEFLMIDFDETVSYLILYENHIGQIDTGLAVIDSFGIETLLDGNTVEVQYLHILNNGSVEDEFPFKVYKNVGFVGSSGLLFPNLGTGLCDVMTNLELRCYTDGIDTLHFTPYDCYESTLGSATHDPDINEIILSPNPVSEEIVLPDDFLVEQCYSIHGQSVPVFQSGNKLDVHDWQPGLYLLKLSNRYTKEAGFSRIVKH